MFLFFPCLQVFFLFNYAIQKNFIQWDKLWAIWFFLIMQMGSLFIFTDLSIGNFAQYFKIPKTFWTDIVVIYQDIMYSLDIAFFGVFVIALSYDYAFQN